MAHTGARQQRDVDRSTARRASGPREAPPAASVLRLQWAAGNRAVGRIVRQVARRTLDDEVKDARPRGLKLNPTFVKFGADYKPFDGTTLLRGVDVVFAPGVSADRASRGGLQTIAVDNVTAFQKDKPKLVSLDDATEEIYIDFAHDFPGDDDAKTFAAESELWRFTFVKVKPPARGQGHP